MKVYVDELPKDCFECACFNSDNDGFCPCQLSREENNFADFYKFSDMGEENCPLQLISTHDEEIRADERKKIFDMIYDVMECADIKYLDHNYDEFALDYDKFKIVLNKIEKGESNE